MEDFVSNWHYGIVSNWQNSFLIGECGLNEDRVLEMLVQDVNFI